LGTAGKMARRIQDKNLDSKDARRKLPPRGKPHWRGIERGLHLGYRRLREGAGPWIVRRYVGKQQYEEKAIGIADDLSDADGVKGLDYWQAVDAARGTSAEAAAKKPYTVADAVHAYLDYLTGEKKSEPHVRSRMEAHVLPVLGDTEVGDLDAETLRQWLRDLAAKPARVRSPRGQSPRHREVSDDAETIRKRRASANQCLVPLKAALNRAFDDGLVSSAEAWRKVKAFRGVNAARVRYLKVAECKRLLNACDPDFRNLIRGALETGARYGELTRLKVEDYNPDVGTVAIYINKTDAPRHVVLTADGDSFFRQLCAGRTGPMFLHADGRKWGPSHQGRRIRLACKRARIEPPINFHALRHTWASLSVMAGMPLMVVAKNLGHSDTKMVEKHYGHLAPSYVASEIRAKAPRFGKVASNVKAIR
jgi:integrase